MNTPDNGLGFRGSRRSVQFARSGSMPVLPAASSRLGPIAAVGHVAPQPRMIAAAIDKEPSAVLGPAAAQCGCLRTGQQRRCLKCNLIEQPIEAFARQVPGYSTVPGDEAARGHCPCRLLAELGKRRGRRSAPRRECARGTADRFAQAARPGQRPTPAALRSVSCRPPDALGPSPQRLGVDQGVPRMGAAESDHRVDKVKASTAAHDGQFVDGRSRGRTVRPPANFAHDSNQCTAFWR